MATYTNQFDQRGTNPIPDVGEVFRDESGNIFKRTDAGLVSEKLSSTGNISQAKDLFNQTYGQGAYENLAQYNNQVTQNALSGLMGVRDMGQIWAGSTDIAGLSPAGFVKPTNQEAITYGQSPDNPYGGKLTSSLSGVIRQSPTQAQTLANAGATQQQQQQIAQGVAPAQVFPAPQNLAVTPQTQAVQQNPQAQPVATQTTADALKSLQAKLGTNQAQAPTPINPPQVNLQPGQSGADVQQLQSFLIQRGYNIPDGATGYFGPQTKAALSQFQRDNKVDAGNDYGFYGPKTREALAKLGGNIQTSPSAQPMGVSATDMVDNAFATRGLSINDTKAKLDPLQAVKDTIKEVLNSYGVSDITAKMKNLSSEVETLANERDDKIREINDNPWTSQGTKNAEITKIQDRYENKIANRTKSLSLLQDTYKTAVDEAQYMAGLVQKYYDNQATLAQDQYQFELNNALKQQELASSTALAEKKFAEDKRQFGLEYALKQSDLQLAREKAQTGGTTANTATQNQTYDLYNLAAKIVNTANTDKSAFNTAFGLKGPSNYLPGTDAQMVKNQVNQLKANLSLESRQKLKGSGAISDFEARTLERSASALDFNLKDTAAKKEIVQIKGALGSAQGIPQKVNVTDPQSGKMKTFTLDREKINSAVSQGYVVEYAE